MTGTYRKEMIIRVNDSNERDIFINLLRERIKLDLYLSAKPGCIRLRLIGPRENVKMAIGEIKQIQKLAKGLLYPDKQGLFTYELEFLVREAGASIRIETLQRLLKFKGYKADSSPSGLIKTDASIQKVVDLIRNLTSVIRETRRIIEPRNVREQIAVLAVLSDLEPFTILERALELGMIRKEEKDRYSFTVSVNSFIDTFLRTVPSNHVNNESNLS